MVRRPADATNTYHHGDLRNALVAAGMQALEDLGPTELSLRKLARIVGVSEAAPSRHFSGKDELLAAIAAEGFHDLVGVRRRIATAGGTPQWTVLQMMKSYVKFARGHPGLFALMVGPRILPLDEYPDLVRESDASFDLFAGAVRTFASQHGWPDDQLNHAVHAAWAAEHGLATLLLAKRAPRSRYPVDVEDMVSVTCGVLMAGVISGPSTVAGLVAIDG